MTRDLILAARAKRYGAKYSLRIIWEARRARVPISWAFALVEQESAFRNIFGADLGSILSHQAVTRARVQMLIRHVRNGGVSNGVGLTQLTSLPLILEAERLGGAHKPANQLRIGLEYLATCTAGCKSMHLAWRYNGDPKYQHQIKALQKKWHERLSK